MNISTCNCKKQDPTLLEGGNCICTECNCHSYKQNIDENVEQFRKIMVGIIGTSTFILGLYIFCCEKHFHF